MSVYINSDLIEMDEQSVEQGEPSFCDDTEEVSRISRNIKFDWQRPRRKLTGRERYLALCKKLGLKPKEPKTMSRDKNYQRLLNSPRWREVKTQVWRRANGLCERCIREGKAAGVSNGYITPGVDCHHIRPVESGRTVMEMEQLCYNPANIELLCIPCHIKTHQEMRSHTREKVKENKARARQRFMELNDPNYQPPEQPKPYGQQADEYMKNLEERARLETLND